MRRNMTFGWIAPLFGAALLATTALAQDAGPSLDEQLGLEPERRAPAAREQDVPRQPASSDQARPGHDVALDPAVARRLSTEEAGNALKKAIAEMGDVAQRLGKSQDAGVQTQRMQQAILDKLDQVIAAAQRQQQKQQSSSSSSSSSSSQQQQQKDSGSQKNAQQSNQPGEPQPGQEGQQRGPNQQGENRGETENPQGQPPGSPNEALEATRNEWGELPPKIREQLDNVNDEEFSPLYRDLTERYYKRLAEERR
jgi:hypothetical protein